jgi:acetyl-CoA synthetase
MSDRTIDTLLDEDRRFPPDPAFAAQAIATPEIYDLDPARSVVETAG